MVVANPKKPLPNLNPHLPDKYWDYADVFVKKNADLLPLHWDNDCPIDLQCRAKVPYGLIYAISHPEMAALRAYIQENLAKGFI